jgi:hypothetical protein
MVSILDLLGGGAGGAKNQLIDPQKALPGRPQKMAGIDGLKHYVLKNPLTDVPTGYKEAIFANGCFWGTEKSFWRLPQGTFLVFLFAKKKRKSSGGISHSHGRTVSKTFVCYNTPLL